MTMEESIRIRTWDGQYLIIGGAFQDMLAVVRGIQGRRYRPEEKLWEIPAQVGEVQQVVEAAGFHVTSDPDGGRAIQRSAARASHGSADRVLIRVGDAERAVVGGAFQAMLDAVKAIEGKRWLSQERVWSLPGSLEDVENILAGQGFRVVSLEEAGTIPADSFIKPAAPAPEAAPRRRDQIHIRALDGEAWIVGGQFRAMLEAIKGIEGRRFLAEAKLWELPCSLVEVQAALEPLGYMVELEGAASLVEPPSGEEGESPL